MSRYDRQRFEHRFYRGLTSQEHAASENEWCKRVCACGRVHLGKRDADHSICFECSPKPYSNIRVSIEVGSEDSTNEQRVREGTSQYNLGLRGVDTVVGTNPDGTPKLQYRPVSNNEVSTARARREYAKRTGCTPQEGVVKRAVGGR